jgi:hypothetical protein
LLVSRSSSTLVAAWSWPNLVSESETCVGSRVRLVGVSIPIEKNFYRLPFTPLSGSPYRSFNLFFRCTIKISNLPLEAEGIQNTLQWV